MTLNLEEIRLVVDELRSELAGARVVRIYEPAGRRFVFRMRKRKARKDLLIDISPSGSRIHLTARKFKNPPTPPRTCQFLRSRLEGAVLSDISVLEPDRIVRIEFSGPRGRFALVVELFGPNSNLCVLDEGGRLIFAADIKRFERRGIGLGDGYRPPEAPASTTAKKPRFPVSSGGSISAAIDEFYLTKERDDVLSRVRRSLERELRRELAGIEKAISDHSQNIEKGRDAELLRRKAEALIAFGKEIPRGSTTAVVPDPYDPDSKLTVELDPSLDAYRNADRLFKRARKIDRAVAVAQRSIEELRTRAARIEREYEEKLASLESMSTDELESLAGSGGAIRKPARAGGPREFVSRDGLVILVGRNERENHE
ncbi:MAG TPA: hypothetical protein ENF73_02740, partial [Proteobacteria bacterium]|nr:hypothetical protein [Pseudomonadota bacterium]